MTHPLASRLVEMATAVMAEPLLPAASAPGERDLDAAITGGELTKLARSGTAIHAGRTRTRSGR